MTAIIIPRKHLSQPQGRVELAPEWAGIINRAYVAGQSHDLAYDFWYGTAPYELNPNPTGLWLRFAEQQGVALTSGGGFSSIVNVDAPVFVVCLSVRTEPTSRWSFADYDYAGNPGAVSFGARFDAPGALLRVRNASGSNLVETTFTNVIKPGVNSHVFGHTPNSLGYIANGDGVYKSAVSAAGSRGPGASARFGSGGDFAGQRFIGSIGLFAVGSGDLPKTEALDLAANPWQLFRADPIRIYSLPTGAISLSINSITASNITQTGARITLGLTR